jgi:CheY-like chemotaxis protein
VDDVPENLRLLEPFSRTAATTSCPPPTAAPLSSSSSARILTSCCLNVLMPEMDGYAVCRSLRSREDTAVLPVIMITSSSGPEKTQAIDAGADDFIPKPFNHHELLTRVRSLLRKALPRRHQGAGVPTQVEELDLQRLRQLLSPQLADAIVGCRAESTLGSHRRQVINADGTGQKRLTNNRAVTYIGHVVGSGRAPFVQPLALQPYEPGSVTILVSHAVLGELRVTAA